MIKVINLCNVNSFENQEINLKDDGFISKKVSDILIIVLFVFLISMVFYIKKLKDEKDNSQLESIIKLEKKTQILNLKITYLKELLSNSTNAIDSLQKLQNCMQVDYPQELFRIDVGRVHGVKPGNIVGAIANEAGLESRYITGLKIHEDHSTVRLPKNLAKELMQGLNKAWVCGRQLKLTSLGAA